MNIEGLDGAVHKTQREASGLDPFFFVKIAEDIEKFARENYKGTDGGSIIFKADRDFSLIIELTDESAVGCLLDAIHAQLDGMPLSTQAVFGDLIEVLSSSGAPK